MANQVVHFEVMGKDGQALRSFYGELFGWQFSEVEGMDYGTVAPGDGGIGGGVGGSPDQPAGHTTFYVQVDDLEGALEQAKSLGGQPAFGPMDLPGGGRIALFSDPEGHTVGLFTPPQGD